MSGGWADAEVSELAEYIRGRTGLTFPPGRREAAAATLALALAEKGGVDRSIAHLEENPAALDEVLAELTIGETYFFRHPEQFEVIRSRVLPEWKRKRRSTVRVWSAGCATGEEAYSLAILLREGAVPGAKILGTDLSRARLTVARKGRFRSWSLRGLPRETIDRYFTMEGKWFELDPEIRAAVEFRYLNLVEDRYPSATSGIWGLDLILCRNVLIYLDRASIARVAARLVDSLRDDGWLFLGASDPPIADFAPVEVIVTEAGLAYRKAGATVSREAAQPVREQAIEPPQRETPPPRQPEPELPVLPAPAPAASERATATEVADDDLERWYWEQRYDAVVAAAANRTDRGTATHASRVLLARALANQGQIRAAGEATLSALETFPHSAELLHLHARILLEMDRPKEAEIAARRALYLDSGLVVAHVALADASLRLGKRMDARRALRNAERILQKLDHDEIVPSSDGEIAGRLLRIVQFRLRRMDEKVRANG